MEGDGRWASRPFQSSSRFEGTAAVGFNFDGGVLQMTGRTSASTSPIIGGYLEGQGRPARGKNIVGIASNAAWWKARAI